jgi:hypothetical protein
MSWNNKEEIVKKLFIKKCELSDFRALEDKETDTLLSSGPVLESSHRVRNQPVGLTLFTYK